ncbi:MAG: endonuclease/exonuclease/phosphatase family protein [Muribaculaceae bacterium]|nr:endonuclease/exonuclease/phosphatase family protein [Muribaculaceae bacterium]
MIVLSPVIRIVGKILSVILYAATLLAAFGGHFNPHLFTVPAALTLTLPYLVILTVIISIFWLCCRRWIIGALGVLTIIAGWSDISSAVPLNFSKEADPSETTFSIIAYNILHTSDYREPNPPENRSIRFLIDSGADIICLEEMYSMEEGARELEGHEAIADTLRRLYPHRAGGGGTDILVLSKYPVEKINLPNPGNTFKESIYLFFRVMIKEQSLTLAVVHLPSFSLSEEERTVITDLTHTPVKNSVKELNGPIRGKLAYAFATRASATKELIETLEDINGPLIVCGDFNDVPASWVYRSFMKAGFRDAFAETNFGPMITYNGHLMYFHLDQMLYRGNLRALSLKKGSINSSDHYPLIGTFAFTPSP